MKIEKVHLVLEDFAILVNIGIHEPEIGQPQRLLISVQMEISNCLKFDEDSITNTIDYDFIRLEIKELCGMRRYKTQEALCHDILRIVLQRDGVLSAIVKTKKTEIYPDAKAVGCQMEGFASHSVR